MHTHVCILFYYSCACLHMYTRSLLITASTKMTKREISVNKLFLKEVKLTRFPLLTVVPRSLRVSHMVCFLYSVAHPCAAMQVSLLLQGALYNHICTLGIPQWRLWTDRHHWLGRRGFRVRSPSQTTLCPLEPTYVCFFPEVFFHIRIIFKV